MTAPDLATVAGYLDDLLGTAGVPDYPQALNGVQVANRGPIRGLATAVDCSERALQGTVARNANLLLVHHGLFWGGLRPLTGMLYRRVSMLLEHDIALYAAHLPLDAHARFGNSRLLAVELGLVPAGGFGRFEGIDCGVRGEADIPTSDLLARLRNFAHSNGSELIASAFAPERRTRRWAICTGAGVNAASLDEAVTGGIDTLISGEGPHWGLVDAPERDLVIAYAGHYATETLGVRALGEHVAARFGLPHVFIEAPTGS